MEEEGQCWIWTKRKQSSLSSYSTRASRANKFTYGDSWEEQAFAEDERAGGCIWPPTSYSCSFCSREFRSAQALGGHMNVHRRDRARLKQLPSPHKKEETSLNHQNSFTSSLAYPNTNPNSDHPKQTPRYDYCISRSNFAGERLYSQKVDLIGTEDKKMSKILDTDDCEDEADRICCKRRRITDHASSIIPFSSKSISVDNRHRHIKSQMVEFINPRSVEELDLELRLGQSPPKV